MIQAIEEILEQFYQDEMPDKALQAIMQLIEERDKKLFAEQPNESVAYRTERLRIKRLAEELR